MSNAFGARSIPHSYMKTFISTALVTLALASACSKAAEPAENADSGANMQPNDAAAQLDATEQEPDAAVEPDAGMVGAPDAMLPPNATVEVSGRLHELGAYF